MGAATFQTVEVGAKSIKSFFQTTAAGGSASADADCASKPFNGKENANDSEDDEV